MHATLCEMLEDRLADRELRKGHGLDAKTEGIVYDIRNHDWYCVWPVINTMAIDELRRCIKEIDGATFMNGDDAILYGKARHHMAREMKKRGEEPPELAIRFSTRVFRLLTGGMGAKHHE